MTRELIAGRARLRAVAAALAVTTGLLMAQVEGAQPRFFSDDPLPREPETQDASGATPWEIDLFYDLAYNLFVTPRKVPAGVRAQNINTVDEVPDSSWFTNRIGARPLTNDELIAGPNSGKPPDPSTWTVIREKTAGYAAGFTARDAGGDTWFVSFDAPSNPDGATGAIIVASKLFWALGYNQVENFLTDLDFSRIRIDPAATVRRPSGSRTAMTADDVQAQLGRALKRRDGTYRVNAGRLLPGKVLGGFRYEDTRSDDPNDIVPHQHRRELRALRVFGAWTNLTDMKAGNTLDTIVTDGPRSVVRHYLQDVGSTFGVGANGPHDWNEGWEYVWQAPPAIKRLLTFGFAFGPWQFAPYERNASIGRFEGDDFDPLTWKPRAPTTAYFEMRDDDAFWAARRVMAFSDEAIRTVVGTARFSDPRAATLLAEVLIKRRDRIGAAYLPRINPIVEPALDGSGVLTFANAAVDHKVATAPRRYTAVWSAFDNATDAVTRIGDTSGDTTRITAPAGLPAAAGAYVRVEVSAEHPEHPSWARPVHLYFRRAGAGWFLVGLERVPGQP
jgi:hypothetical protein